MPLASGKKLGTYEIKSLLGAGGMGEVYCARDSRLERDVALKVLPPAFARDFERMARFDREAKVLASLNHPNIASIYGLEESDSARALIMELVEGPTLAERIHKGPLLFEEALSVARQIAEALEYAHERGVIHRDLKPANIKLTAEHQVKLLDFGLAKALEDESTEEQMQNSPTLSAMATRTGILLGTAAYMSPEQARGKRVDRRADIWSFGCVLFEMLTGRAVFSGESVGDTVAAVLSKDPEWERLPAATPPGVRRLIEKCLQKDLKKRLQAIGDVRIEIDDLLAGQHSGQPLHPSTGEDHKRNRKNWVRIASPVVVALLFAGAVGLVAQWVQGRSAKPLNWKADVIPGPYIAMGPRISPDGGTLAFQAMIDNVTQVAVASPDSGNWTVLTRDREHGFVNEISWAPDGSKLYFDRTIATPVGVYSIPALGGKERLVLENAGSPEALPDGSLLVIRGDGNGRWRICHFWPDSQRLEPLPGWVSISTTIPMRVFPDGKEVVFNGTATNTDVTVRLYVMDIATGKTRQLAPDLPTRNNNESYPIAPTADGHSVLLDIPSGDLHRIVAVPRDGKGAIQTFMALTKPPWYMDMARDGTLYLDQVDRPHEILRFPVRGGQPEVLGSSDTYVPAGQYMEPVETTDGRFLLDTVFAGRGRLLIGKPGADFVPLLDTRDETSSPSASMRNNQIALVLGSGSEAMIVIASATEGRVVRQLRGTQGRRITSLAVSADEETLYFGADGFIWAVPVTDGTPQKIAVGDDVTVDPNGRELILTQSQTSNPTLVKIPVAGGTAEKVHVEDGQWIAPVPIGSRAITRDQKMLISVSPLDSWFYRVVVLDLATGRITPINVSYPGDTLSGNWTPDGRVISLGLSLKSHVWRFRPAEKGR